MTNTNANVVALINTIANGTLEDAVKADQAMRDMPAEELQAGFDACSTDEMTYALMRWDEVEAFRAAAPKKFEMTAEQKELSKGFKAVVEAKQGLISSMISLENIEAKSATSLATAIVHALEKEGFYTQWLPTQEDGTPFKHYAYSAKSANFDSRSVAVLAVQLAGILPYIDRPIAMADVAAVAVFRRRMRDIARANRFIPNMYHESIDKTEHWHAKLEAALDMALRAGLLTQDEDGLIMHSRKYISSCISRTGIMHQREAITVNNRRKERVKTRSNPKRDGTSREVRDAVEFIESQSQFVNSELLKAIVTVRDMFITQQLPLPEVLATSSHIIDGCAELDGQELFSEVFQDLRGRMYQFAHRGPNPQGSDMAKALCYHSVRESVKVGTPEHEMFLNEMFNEVIGDDVWAQENYIRRTAADPVAALIFAFNKHQGDLPFTKFFTYMDMCRTWVDFQDKGEAITQLGFGPDAKCSGAQIFSILAGCEKIAESCGLITGFTEKPADPYKLSSFEVNKITQTIKNKMLVPTREITRNEIKTPFMAIQYGGGIPALRYKKFEPTMEALGIPEHMRDTFCGDVVIEGINNALGNTIGTFIQTLREAAQWYCDTNNVDSFDYRHVDGFKVTKKGEASVQMTDEPFIINHGAEGQGVIFGSMKNKTGWFVPSRTTGPLQRQNFIYYFPVHFIQGIDAVVARRIALEAKEAGLRGYTSIHDQFRTCLADATQLRATCVPNAYKHIFMDNDPVAHLSQQIGVELNWGNPLEPRKQVLSEEILYSTDAYYFE